jgi:hypothetical protein
MSVVVFGVIAVNSVLFESVADTDPIINIVANIKIVIQK